MAEETPDALFEGVAFTVIPTDTVNTERIIEELEGRGGTYIPLREIDQDFDDLDLDQMSHIISTSIDFPKYGAAIERGIAVVKPSWAYQCVGRGKLVSTRQHSPDPSQYFQDVVVTAGDIPEGDRDAIVAGVVALGGHFSKPLSKLTTHIVTLDMEDAVCTFAREKKLSCKMVLPHWFDDCLWLGKKISEEPYRFPNPQILGRSAARPMPSDSAHVTGAIDVRPKPTDSLPHTPPSSPSNARKNLNAFMGRQIMLSSDLNLAEHLVKTLETLINHGGGTLTGSVDDADILICHYRDGADYVAASRARKEVANLSWLYHVINQNKYSSPLSKLLHYPIPRNPIPGFENMRISLSNYSGDARIYLENLIGYCGASFTKTMKQDNSHLITAHTRSEKCDAAQEWDINVINHLWLEESYAKCAAQSLTVPRYTRFPDRTNLGEVVGLTRLDMNKVEQMYFAKARESLVKLAQPPTTQMKAKPSPRKTVPASSAVGAERTPRGTVQQTAPTSIGENDETEGEQEQPQTTKKTRGRPRKSDIATPRLAGEEKENQSPFPSTGRAAKTKAFDRLQAAGADKTLYDKEMKRKGGVTHGGSGRRSSHLEDLSSPVPVAKKGTKRKSDEHTYDATAEGSDLSDGETQNKGAKNVKKAKLAGTPTGFPPVEYKMMVTGDERWIGKQKQEDADKTKLRMLGVLLTQDPREVDILVAPKILRTRKFVAALAAAPLVVDSKYLDNALKQNKLMDKPALLQDRDTEERFGFKLTEALARAKINDRKLLRGWSIFVAKDIQGGFDTFKEIITLNGGDAYNYAARTGLKMAKRRTARDDPEAGQESQHQGGEEEDDFVYLVSGKSEAEAKLWKHFRAIAEENGLQARIASTDWLLNAAMSQQVRWEEKWALDETAVLSQRNG
ncbi:hypothetical protein LTR08_008940 [Meristemomyces frigidus]|nr:hypothetical protein LTR08_008940 [Meristemomyces frigidus]